MSYIYSYYKYKGDYSPQKNNKFLRDLFIDELWRERQKRLPKNQFPY